MLEPSNSFEGTPLGQMAMEKAKELFDICDSENKGFIIKRDMQRLRGELPGLTPDQLEEVFGSLDSDGNGFLTMEEFVRGFGVFLGLQIPDDELPQSESELSYGDKVEAEASTAPAVEQEQFQQLIDQIGAGEVLKDQVVAKDLWSKLRRDDPELLDNFETFLASVSSEIKRSQDEFSSLESALHQKSNLHEEEVRKLYMEMENQLRQERERILEQEKQKAERQKEDMEKEIQVRDQQLQDLLAKQSEMERNMGAIASVKTLTEQENEALQKDRDNFDRQKCQMEKEMEETRKHLEESKVQLENIRRQAREERRERAKNAFKVTEGIANEREDLVQQLDSLRIMNQQLKDQKDMMPFESHGSPSAQKKSSRLGAYLQGTNSDPTKASSHPLEDDSEEDVELESHRQTGPVHHVPPPPGQGSLMDELGDALRSEEATSPEFSPHHPRVEPLGGNEVVEGANGSTGYEEKYASQTPERIFKVVFVGDSGVGKTCFLHRFCHNRFKPTFSATIGVDFQVKTLVVENKLVALQLWDTAGQERFRSITKQYFRKADGVILMYDVTSELSFINLRNWMESVRQGVEKDCVLCLVGNKLDLYETEESRVLKFKDGEKLADEYKTLFFETSASTGEGVEQCMKAMAMLLRDREDKHLEDALKLEMEVPKQKKCCGRG